MKGKFLLFLLIPLLSYSQDGFKLAALQQGGGGGVVDTMLATNPDIWVGGGSLLGADNSVISILTDKSGNGHNMDSNGDDDALVNVASDGYKEIEFFGDEVFFIEDGGASSLDYDPDVDSFSYMLVDGEIDNAGSSNFSFQYGSNGSSVSQSQYGIQHTSATDFRTQSGGVQSNNISGTSGEVDVIIVTSTPSNAVTWLNGVEQTSDDFNPGTYTTTNKLRLGSRGAGTESGSSGSSTYDGSIREYASWGRVLTNQEIADLTEFFDVDVVSAPTGIYDIANVLSPTDEANDVTTGFESVDVDFTFTSDTGDPQDGTYSLEAVTLSSGFFRIERPSTFAASTSYDISIDVSYNGSVDAQVYTNSGEEWTSDEVVAIDVKDGTWTTYTITDVEVSSISDSLSGAIRIYFDGAGTWYLDNVRWIEN